MADVVLHNVTKVYPGGVTAVSDMDLQIADRELVVLVGGSGCGKTTTLRMIAGLEDATAGEILIGGRCVNAVPPRDRDVAMVFQNYALYPHMTVQENLAFSLKLKRLGRDEISRRVGEVARTLGLGDLLDRKPKALSGGQRQRVALGRAIIRKPRVFLFDEPLSNLDAKLRAQMRVEIAQLQERLQTTMIYVTHDQAEAMTMGDRIVVMKDGMVQQIADPLTIYDAPANRFVAGFMGTPAMNFFDGKITVENERFAFNADGMNLPLPAEWKDKLAAFAGRTATLGIRPEDVGSAQANAQADCPRVRARVELVEPMGSESYVHLRLAGQPLVVRADAHRRFAVGEEAEMALFMPKAHLFELENGQTIL